ncbi:hypothetical protein TNCV_790721 [Trichonephila clavipes]|nr:hypothetical protein TNCV_790721 [Trichonephila clavipes]
MALSGSLPQINLGVQDSDENFSGLFAGTSSSEESPVGESLLSDGCRCPVRISSDPEVMNNGRTKKRKRVRELRENLSRTKTGKVRTDGGEEGGLEIVGGGTTI